jgi:hypothetical protein
MWRRQRRNWIAFDASPPNTFIHADLRRMDLLVTRRPPTRCVGRWVKPSRDPTSRVRCLRQFQNARAANTARAHRCKILLEVPCLQCTVPRSVTQRCARDDTTRNKGTCHPVRDAEICPRKFLRRRHGTSSRSGTKHLHPNRHQPCGFTSSEPHFRVPKRGAGTMML